MACIHCDVPPKFMDLRFQVPSNGVEKDMTTRAFSLTNRVGMTNKTAGTTQGKSNYAMYAAIPDPKNESRVFVLGYTAYYFISPQPTCCKAHLDLPSFRKTFEGTYLFTKLDSTWTHTNDTTWTKDGPSNLGTPCKPDQHSVYAVTLDSCNFPVSTYQVVPCCNQYNSDRVGNFQNPRNK